MGKNFQNQIFIAIESEKSFEEKWCSIFREFLTTLMKGFGWLVLLSDLFYTTPLAPVGGEV